MNTESLPCYKDRQKRINVNAQDGRHWPRVPVAVLVAVVSRTRGISTWELVPSAYLATSAHLQLPPPHRNPTLPASLNPANLS